MKHYKVGIAREGKVPPDFRVPLTPEQCALVHAKFPNVELIVQNSPIRTFSDDEYRVQGIRVQEDLSECDIIMGVKEFVPETLIANKTYIFFSHTLKKQPYNRHLLQTVLQKKIRLIDYEVMKNRIGKRLIGFGRYAGIVGCYNGFRALGLKSWLRCARNIRSFANFGSNSRRILNTKIRSASVYTLGSRRLLRSQRRN